MPKAIAKKFKKKFKKLKKNFKKKFPKKFDLRTACYLFASLGVLFFIISLTAVGYYTHKKDVNELPSNYEKYTPVKCGN